MSSITGDLIRFVPRDRSHEDPDARRAALEVVITDLERSGVRRPGPWEMRFLVEQFCHGAHAYPSPADINEQLVWLRGVGRCGRPLPAPPAFDPPTDMAPIFTKRHLSAFHSASERRGWTTARGARVLERGVQRLRESHDAELAGEPSNSPTYLVAQHWIRLEREVDQ